jgi:ferredoxin
MTIAITIERDGCIQCGACADACGELFEVPNGEASRIVEKYRAGSEAKGSAPDDLLNCAQDAEVGCPVSIITVDQQ